MAIEPIIYGDNQFFGVNHASEEKARQQIMRFQDISVVEETLHQAYEAGLRAFACTTHETIVELTDMIKASPERWEGMHFYPGMPYAHKYANAVTEHGYFDALKMLLPGGSMFSNIMRGGKALAGRDVAKLATLLVDAEMKPFAGLSTPVIFLQNIVTDLILGLGNHDAFKIFADHIADKYKAEAGFFTMNLPRLVPVLNKVGLKNPIVCANVNKAGFRMSGGIDAYRQTAEKHQCRVIAMSVLASGAIPAKEAISWASNEPYVESILFGASSRTNIDNTVKIIHQSRGK